MAADSLFSAPTPSEEGHPDARFGDDRRGRVQSDPHICASKATYEAEFNGSVISTARRGQLV
jgi:hypothetical protein